jgi:flagellar biosynthesis chaperone FliJ
MTLATYSTKAPEIIFDFLTDVSQLFSVIERQLYRDLQNQKPLKKLKKDYQIIYGINARQFNSIRIFLQGKMKSRTECYQSQIKDLEEKIKHLKKSIKNLTNRVKLEKLNAKKTASPKKRLSCLFLRS